MKQIKYNWTIEVLISLIILISILFGTGIIIFSGYSLAPASVITYIVLIIIAGISSVIISNKLSEFFLNNFTSKPKTCKTIYHGFNIIGNLSIAFPLSQIIMLIISSRLSIGETKGYLIILLVFGIIQTIFTKSTKEYYNKPVNYKMWIVISLVIIFLVIQLTSSATQTAAKPVIYLYPEEITNISVDLQIKNTLAKETLVTYPLIKNGWEVTAHPDGKILQNGKEYAYLFWEAESNIEWNFKKGFLVKGSESLEFLERILPEIGLTPKEYNEFIVYWYPLMKQNKYNLVSFQTKQYEEEYILNITPKPDSILRVFMAYKPIKHPIEIEPQTFPKFARNGFTVVEWGGTFLN